MNPDFDALAAIHAACFPRGWSAGELAGLVRQNGVILRSAPDAQQPLGFILIQSVLDEAEILTIAVAPSARRQGLGRILLTEAETAAQAGGVRKIFLDVSQNNSAALALYRSEGFVETGCRPAYYSDGSDAVLMEKTLPALDGAERSA